MLEIIHSVCEVLNPESEFFYLNAHPLFFVIFNHLYASLWSEKIYISPLSPLPGAPEDEIDWKTIIPYIYDSCRFNDNIIDNNLYFIFSDSTPKTVLYSALPLTMILTLHASTNEDPQLGYHSFIV